MFYVMVAAALLLPRAHAADPAEPTIQDDGTVRSEVVVAGDLAAVRKLIGDPVAAASLSPDVISARVVQHGTCDVVEVVTRGMTSNLKYLVKRCPTADGWHEALVSSEDFNEVKVDWDVTAVPGGTKVVYTIRTLPDLPVPQRLITSLTAKSAVQALKNLVHRVTGQ
jgi:hypothetical protein